MRRRIVSAVLAVLLVGGSVAGAFVASSPPTTVSEEDAAAAVVAKLALEAAQAEERVRLAEWQIVRERIRSKYGIDIDAGDGWGDDRKIYRASKGVTK